jgi:cobalamin biosynthetic protein CobC
MMSRDHGGGLDAACARWGGRKEDWVDLSTGINPVPYPVGALHPADWTRLPDRDAMAALLAAARGFWQVPDSAVIVAAPGLSAIIAALPRLIAGTAVDIARPTYNEYAHAFAVQGWAEAPGAPVRVRVHPNNPDGRLWGRDEVSGPGVTVIDESFCDVLPGHSHIGLTAGPGVIVLKSFGKFWGLAGLRLGFAIAAPEVLCPPGRPGLADLLGPWAVSGPALQIGARALTDEGWARATRIRLAEDAGRLDRMLAGAGAEWRGGTSLFRLYEGAHDQAWEERLARGRVLGRIFPYSSRWLRLGLPAPHQWDQLEAALWP